MNKLAVLNHSNLNFFKFFLNDFDEENLFLYFCVGKKKKQNVRLVRKNIIAYLLLNNNLFLSLV